MPVPSPRNKILPVRGDIATLQANIASILEGEICYAFDKDQYYQKENGVLVPAGASKDQGALADSAVQPGDNVSTLTNDANYITSAGAPVQSVAGRAGDVVLVKADITDFSDADYATSAQGTTADSAIQPGDNVSELANDAGYITAAGAPGTDLSYTSSTRVLASSTGADTTLPEVVASGDSGLITGADKAKLDNIETGAQVNTVTSVAGRTGDVVLTKADVGLNSVDNTSDADKPVSTAQQAILDVKADLVGGVIPTSQIPAIAITEFLGSVGSEAAMLALTGQPGDWCLRTDKAVGYVIVGADPSLASNWEAFTVPGSAVTSINSQIGDVVLGFADVGAASAAQGTLADSAVQPGDNVSDLNNDSGYITLAEVPPGGVTSVNTQTGDVVLDAGDVGAVPVTGGTFSGNIEIGTGIDLNASGSGTFAGKITSDSTVSGDAGTVLATKDYVDAATGGGVNYSGAAAWGKVASNGSLTAGMNIASTAPSGTGIYNVTFTTPMPSADYAVILGFDENSGASTTLKAANQTANGFTAVCLSNPAGGAVANSAFGFAVFATNSLPPQGGTGADAWATVDQNGVLEAGFNIASCTYSGAGTYDYVFTTPMPTANYAVLVASDDVTIGGEIRSYAKTTTGFTVFGTDSNGSSALAMSHSVVVHATNATLPSTFTVEQFNDLVARVTALENA